MAKAELLRKLKIYDVSTSGLRLKELEILYSALKKTEDIDYDKPEYIEYIPVDVKSSEDIKGDLKRKGWAVVDVPNWDSTYKNQFQDIIESFCPFKFNDSSTWLSKNLPYNLHGIMKYDLGHTNLQWEIRENMIPIFEEIYDTNELLCSFDSMNLSFKRKGDANGWFHVDQNYKVREMDCYQGVVNLVDNSDLDGGLIIVDKSHRIFDEYMDNHPKTMFGWRPVNIADPLVKDLKVYKINLKEGQACIWNSKTCHTNCQPLSSNLRMATYVSMLPRENCPDKDFGKKIKYFEEKRVTNHWAHTGVTCNPKTSRYGDCNPRAPASLNIKELNEIQRGLVGYEM
jgi:hypothetical protein